MKRILLLTLVFSFVAITTMAQRTVSGKVTDDSGEALPGVNVVIKGTTTGVTTDLDGNYRITVESGATLVFSYVGFETQEVPVGSRTTLDLEMSGATELQEVVVTALGISKKKDNDISSASIVKTDAVERSGEAGLIQGLAGKSSGVLITQNTGDPGAGAWIQIRGQNTINGSTGPLIIVDGVPMSNSSYGAGTAGVVQQSRLNDLAASDIESMTVLKGAAAAAVWGTAAANGVLVIKTKKGRVDGGNFAVDFNASWSVDQINREHEKQGIYGQGAGGVWNSNASGLSWGDRIADRAGGADAVDTSGPYFVGDQTGTTYYPVTAKNSREVFNDVNRNQVFRDGSTSNYSLGVSYVGADKSNTYFGINRLDQKGIINGFSDYTRNSLRLNHSREFSDRVTGRINASYINTESNRIQTGSNLNGLYLGYLRTAPDFNNTDYSGTYYSGPNDAVGVPRSHRSYRARQIGQGAAIYNNPGWTINNNLNPNRTDRVIFTPEMNVELLDNMSITARYGVDFWFDKRRTYYQVNSAGDFTQGAYYRDDRNEKTENFNIFLNGNNELGSSVSLNWIAGYMLESTSYGRLSTSTNVFLNADPSKQLVTNATNDNILGEEYNSLNKKNAGYYTLNFTIAEDLLLETTGRLERSTTLTDINFYPSVSAGYILTNKLLGNDGFLSFAKLRANWGQVGIEPQLYINRDIFFSSTAGSEGWGDYLDGANYGGTVRRGAIQGNPDLTRETVTEWEVGTDFRVLNDKLSVGFTYYNRVTTDAIMEIETPATTGYSSAYQNAAEISNTGIEIDWNYNYVTGNGLDINVFGTFTKYKNIVEKLPNVSRIILNGFTSTSSSVVEGAPFGAIYGGRYARNADGSIETDASGFPVIDDEQGVIGDPNPDFRASLGASAAYKGLKFSFMWETSQGNDMWAGTWGVLHYFGIAPETAVESTAPVELPTYLGGTIAQGATFRGSVADFGGGPVALEEGWYRTDGGGFGSLDEQFVRDASWTKLREVSLSYMLPSNIAGKLGMEEIEVGVSGRNLIIITDFPGIDPEVNLTGASRGRGLDYFTNPATQSYLFNLRARF
ncbi:SusC/RagA family TonB-linked outer membrane protein [Ekhidna sp.]|uniref:SusC/RagA family TonB-linked outer membrane protein n=1 Tax=Ekhidna sp. TaxID=2608089 RepID=UPI003CCBEECC